MIAASTQCLMCLYILCVLYLLRLLSTEGRVCWEPMDWPNTVRTGACLAFSTSLSRSLPNEVLESLMRSAISANGDSSADMVSETPDSAQVSPTQN